MAKKEIKTASPEAAQAQQIAAPAVLAVIDGSLAQKLRITSTHEGFRRGGRAWSTKPTVVMADEFTAVQLAQIKAEPRLVVEIIGSEGDVA